MEELNAQVELTSAISRPPPAHGQEDPVMSAAQLDVLEDSNLAVPDVAEGISSTIEPALDADYNHDPVLAAEVDDFDDAVAGATDEPDELPSAIDPALTEEQQDTIPESQDQLDAADDSEAAEAGERHTT